MYDNQPALYPQAASPRRHPVDLARYRAHLPTDLQEPCISDYPGSVLDSRCICLRACLNNRYQAIFGHFQEVLSCFYCCLLRTCRPAGA